jgi:hypothetical protein
MMRNLVPLWLLLGVISLGSGICFGIGIEQMFKGCP